MPGWMLSEVTKYGAAVEVRQQEIQQDGIGLLLVKQLQRGAPARRRLHRAGWRLDAQHARQQAEHFWIIVHDEDGA